MEEKEKVRQLIIGFTKCLLAGADFKINTDPENAWCAFIKCKEDQVLFITRILHRILNRAGFTINMEDVSNIVRETVYNK